MAKFKFRVRKWGLHCQIKQFVGSRDVKSQGRDQHQWFQPQMKIDTALFEFPEPTMGIPWNPHSSMASNASAAPRTNARSFNSPSFPQASHEPGEKAMTTSSTSQITILAACWETKKTTTTDRLKLWSQKYVSLCIYIYI